MIITYLGKEFFKIQQGDLVVACNPVSKDSKEKQTRFGSRIALSTTNHPDFNGFENVTHGDTTPLEISGPGDYEVGGIFVKGVMTTAELSGPAAGGASKTYINTIYHFLLRGSLCVSLGQLQVKSFLPTF